MSILRLPTVSVGLAIILSGLLSHTAPAAEKGTNLSRFISADFCAAIVVHPERISTSPLAAALKSAFPSQGDAPDLSSLVKIAAAQGPLPAGLDADQLAQLLKGKPVHRLVLLVDPFPTPKIPAAPGLIVQFSADIDGQAILAATSKDWKPAEAQGVKYQTVKNPEADQPDIAACVVDNRTILVGLESTVVKMLAKSPSPQALLEQLRKTSLNHDIIVEFIADPLLTKLTQTTGKSVEESLTALGPQGAMFKDLKSLSATLDYSGKTLFHAELVTAKDESSGMLGMLANMGLTAGKEKFEELKKAPPPFPPAILDPLMKLGDEVLKNLKIKNTGPRLIVDLPMPASLPDALKAMGQLAPMLQQLPSQPPPAKK